MEASGADTRLFEWLEIGASTLCIGGMHAHSQDEAPLKRNHFQKPSVFVYVTLLLAVSCSFTLQYCACASAMLRCTHYFFPQTYSTSKS